MLNPVQRTQKPHGCPLRLHQRPLEDDSAASHCVDLFWRATFKDSPTMARLQYQRLLHHQHAEACRKQ